MKTPLKLAVLLPLALLPVGALLALGACEIAVNLDPAAVDAGPMSDVLACPICADVSADADYDAADVSIYGIPRAPKDASKDAVHEAAVIDSAPDTGR